MNLKNILLTGGSILALGIGGAIYGNSAQETYKKIGIYRGHHEASHVPEDTRKIKIDNNFYTLSESVNTKNLETGDVCEFKVVKPKFSFFFSERVVDIKKIKKVI